MTFSKEETQIDILMTFFFFSNFFFLFLKLKMFTQSAAQVVNKEHRNFAANLPNPYKQKRSTHLLFCFFTVSTFCIPFSNPSHYFKKEIF
jgi:hypothetical protein